MEVGVNYSEQMKAWAVDRAIESYKVFGAGDATPAKVTELAQTFVEYVSNPSEEPVTEQ